MNPLFECYPRLADKLHHISFGNYPTPVQQQHIPDHGDIWLKRDDLCSDIYAGNKVRKLEFLLARVLHAGLSGVQTAGGVGSNHVVATSSFCQQIGLRCQAVLVPQPKSLTVRQNLLWSVKNGTRVFYSEAPSDFQAQQARGLQFYQERYGEKPALIPMGGSSALGNIGFVAAAFELETQIKEGLCPKPDVIYLPLGTMGTAVGLSLGFDLLRLAVDIVPVRVVAESLARPKRYETLYRETNALLNQLDPSIPIIEPKRLPEINHKWFGSGYGVYTEAGQQAVNTFEATGT